MTVQRNLCFPFLKTVVDEDNDDVDDIDEHDGKRRISFWSSLSRFASALTKIGTLDSCAL